MLILQQLVIGNWPAILIVSVALVILIILLWRNYDIDEITPAWPFIKFKRKSQTPVVSSASSPSIKISRNWIFGKNRVSARREGAEISNNVVAGENEVEVGAKPGPKPKAQKGKRRP